MKFSIVSLNVGKVAKLKAGRSFVDSAFAKSPVEKALLEKTGFESDQQADLKDHGGVEKAVCVFSLHHFPLIENKLGIELPVPAFGENFSIDRADESEVFIGDVFQCGDVKLQVSQPRQPCIKAGAFLKNNAVIKVMTENNTTGFYFRVLSGGEVKTGETFERVKSDSLYSLALANDIMYRREKSLELLQEFISHDSLSAAWKAELKLRLC